jgi:hypothetical protein
VKDVAELAVLADGRQRFDAALRSWQQQAA